MRTRNPHLALALVALLAGCQSRLTGNEGNLVFSYLADDDVTNFNKPVAVGAFLDVTVAEVGTNRPVELTAADFDDTAVLDVDVFAASTLTVAGVGDGNALLSVEATTAGGEAVTDSVNMQAKTPEEMVLAHTCTTGAEAAYATGQRVWVPFELLMANGQPVIGYGYYPVTLEGSGAAVVVEDGNQQYIALDTAEAAGDVVMQSDLDGTSLSMAVVDPASFDGVEEPIAFVLEDVDAGDTNAFYVRPTVGALVTCQADVDKTVASLTPDVCDVRDADAADPNVHEFGWFEIEGIAAGTCEYTVTFPDGMAGDGATATFSYEIEP